MTPETSVELVGAFLLVLVALVVVTAMLRPLWMPVWRLFRGTQQFLEDWFGEPADERRGTKARPGAMARLAQVETTVDEVKVIAASSHKELHPNGGTSMRDEVREVRDDVREAKASAGRAAQRAEDTARHVESTAEAASQDRQSIRVAMSNMREELAVDAAQRTADAYELLAEHGGPDLRPHAKPVQPHAHELPTVEQPSLTGGPIEPEENP